MPAWRGGVSRSIGRCECASIHSAVSTARRRSRAVAATGLRAPPGDHLDKAAGEQLSDLVEADIAAAIGRGLRQFAEHHQFGQRRRGSRSARCRRWSPIVSTSSGVQEKRQALVAADMVVAADIFVAGMADQHRSRHQFERRGRGCGSRSCPCAHRRSSGSDAAPRTACRPARRCSGSRTPRSMGAAAGSLRSCRDFSPAGAAGNGQQHVEQGLAAHAAARPRSTAAGAWRWRRHWARSCRHSCRPRARDGRAR